MRWLGLLLLAGCAQVFGLSSPHQLVDAAASGDVADLDAAPDAAPGSLLPCHPGDDGLVACFDFEGNVTDLSLSHLSVTSQAVTYVAGHPGQGAELDATSGIRIDETPALDIPSFTEEAWINLAQLPALGARIGIIDNDGQYGMFVIAGGVLECNTTGTLLQGATVSARMWTHVACTEDGASLIQYVDGAETVRGPGGPADTSQLNGTSLGGNSPSGDPLIGDLDSVRIYSTVRTPQEICRDAGGLCR